MKNIVVVDDEQYICNIILEALGEFADFRVNIFTDPDTAFAFIAENKKDTGVYYTPKQITQYMSKKLVDYLFKDSFYKTT